MPSFERPGTTGFTRENVISMLKEAAQAHATDIHFKVPSEPMMRVGGHLKPLSDVHLTQRDTIDIVQSLAAAAGIEVMLSGKEDVEFSFGLAHVGRFRVLCYRQRGSTAIAIQRLQLTPPAIASLPVAPAVANYLGLPGLTLIVGVQRTALLHALVQSYNTRVRGHLVLLESPIAYMHRDDQASIAHREVGQDVVSYASGIRQAVRVGADQIVIGDIADAETADAALTAAEQGFAVLAGASAPGHAQARWWIARLFEGTRRTDVETRLAQTLRAIVVCGETSTQIG